MNLRLIIKKRADDYQIYPAGIPSRWECGKTQAEAIGKWFITNGVDYGIRVEINEHTIEIKTKTKA